MTDKDTTTKKPTIKFKKTRQVTMPVIKLVTDIPRFIQAEKAIYQGKELKGQKVAEGEAKKPPAMLMPVIDLETGEEGLIVLNKVLRTTLEEEYEKEAYVGKQFRITKLTKKKGASGNDYHPFEIIEIEVEVEKAKGK